jgi:hypothetical protein
MVYAPNHFREVNEPRTRGTMERVSVRIFALLAIVVIGITIYSLTDHQRQTKNGCIDFDYTTMIGGAEMYKCGTEAKTLCLTPATVGGVDADFQTSLFEACRKAKLPLSAASSH